LIGDGEGVHWPQLDEDLSAAGLLQGVPAPATRSTPRIEYYGVSEFNPPINKPVHVEPFRDGGWAIVREGNKAPLSVHNTQREAEEKGRLTAQEAATAFYLHDRQGKIRKQRNYVKYVNKMVLGDWLPSGEESSRPENEAGGSTAGVGGIR
jgi:hypothetical protein